MYLIRWKWFYCFYLLLLSICVSAQQADLYLLGEMDCTDNSYCVSIGIKSDSDIFEIGTSSVFVNYNKDALQFTSYSSTSFNGADLCITDIASAWDVQTFDGTSVAGDFNLTMTLLSNTFSCPSIGDTYQEIGVICFNVLDNTLDPDVNINPSNTQFNSALNNDGSNPINMGMVDISGVNNIQCDIVDVNTYDSNCSSIEITGNQSGVIITGMDDGPITSVQVYTEDLELVYYCVGNCQATETIDLPAGTYLVYARYYNTSWGLICETGETITIEETQGFRMNTSSSRDRSVDISQSRAVAIEDIAEDIAIYPNPASANVFIDFKSYAGQKGLLLIHNNLGQVITADRMEFIPSIPFQVDLSTTDAGLHIVSLQLENGTIVSKKLIIN